MRDQNEPPSDSHHGAITVARGLPANARDRAAALYDEAFGAKLAVAIRDNTLRHALLAESLALVFALVALSGETFVGLAGLHTPAGSLTGGLSARALFGRLGLVRGAWAALIFTLYERRPAAGELLMDGIAVHRDFRGRGIGSRLLAEVVQYARDHGFSQVRLDVIDTNPRAKQLYERVGFEATAVTSFPYLRRLLGFGGVTTMVLNVAERP